MSQEEARGPGQLVDGFEFLSFLLCTFRTKCIMNRQRQYPHSVHRKSKSSPQRANDEWKARERKSRVCEKWIHLPGCTKTGRKMTKEKILSGPTWCEGCEYMMLNLFFFFSSLPPLLPLAFWGGETDRKEEQVTRRRERRMDAAIKSKW